MAQHREPRSGGRSTQKDTGKIAANLNQQQENLGRGGSIDQEPGMSHFEKEHSSVPQLIRQLTSDATTLFTKEISLARSEIRESVQEAKTGVMAMTGGGVVMLAGLFVLLMAAVYGLATVLPLWASALIVGGVVTIIGFIMLKSGQSKLSADAFKPERTARELQKDRDAMKRGTLQ